MRRAKHILFDLDGTLSDSKLGIMNCLSYALTQMGVEPPPAAEMSAYFGPPLRQNFAQLLKTEDEATLLRAIGHFRQRYLHERMGILETVLYPDIHEVLGELKRAGKTLFIATSKATDVALAVLRHFECEAYFKDICGCHADGTRSAKQDVIAHILRTHGVTPEEAVMIGDRKHDILGAKAHAMPSIGALWGYGNADELMQAGASVIASRPIDLLEILL